ncbi:MAG: AraC family transcriptional regulator [Chitinophagaceae bacterium]|nr:MAG: AraC family transcriptional regulator [Chitinophagaceae bacterium]
MKGGFYLYDMEDYQKKFILALLAHLAQRGVSPERVCELSGIDYKLLTRGNGGMITAARVNSLWKNGAHLAQDNLLGLHFGESMQLAALGIVGQIVQTSSTVGEALSNAGALTHLITDMFQVRIQHDKTSFRIKVLAEKSKAEKFPFTYRHMSDFLVVFSMHELNGLTLERLQPVQVRFSYQPVDQSEYNRIFRIALTRKTDQTFIEFPLKVLGLPVLSANYELQNHLLNKISILVKEDVTEGALHKKVYNYILSNSFLYALSIEAVAGNFNMSIRSLQRKLKEENITFIEIVDSVKMTLAINYLRSGDHQVKDIAYALGYNEQTAFIRAFKRWTGKTPVVYKSAIETEN